MPAPTYANTARAKRANPVTGWAASFAKEIEVASCCRRWGKVRIAVVAAPRLVRCCASLTTPVCTHCCYQEPTSQRETTAALLSAPPPSLHSLAVPHRFRLLLFYFLLLYVAATSLVSRKNRTPPPHLCQSKRNFLFVSSAILVAIENVTGSGSYNIVHGLSSSNHSF